MQFASFQRERWHMLGIFGLVMGVYLATMPRTVTLEDSGLFIMSCYHLGISHPPGYPLHTLFGKLFMLLLWPISSVAVRVHILSAFFGAATCLLLFWLARCVIPSRVIAWGIAVAYGFSRVFWSQAIIAEVYTLNTFFFFLLLAMAIYYSVRGGRALLHAMAFLYGLSLTNHWPLMALSTPSLVAVVWRRRKEIFRSLPTLIPLFLIGLTPYVWMYLRSGMNPFISFYEPMRGWSDFWYYVTRKGYAHLEKSPTAGLADMLLFLIFLIRQFCAQFTLLGAALAAIGACAQWKKWPKPLAVGLVMGFLGSSLVLVFLVRFDYDFLMCGVFQVYPLVPYGIMSLWIGLGIWWIGSFAQRIFWEGALCAAIVLLAFATNYGMNQRKDYTWARDYAATLLSLLEPNAVLFTHGDLTVGPIGYIRYVEGMRPDVEVYNDQGLIFSNRLFPCRVPAAMQRARLREFVNQIDRPVYYTDNIEHRHGIEDLGLCKKVAKSRPSGSENFPRDPRVEAFFDRIESQPIPNDPWTRFHRDVLMGRLAYIFASQLREVESDAALRNRLERASRNFAGLLGIVRAHLYRREARSISKQELAQILVWLREAEKMIDRDTPKKARAELYLFKGVILGQMGELDAAGDLFRRSAELNPNPEENDAIFNLLLYYAKKRMRPEYAAAKLRYLGGGRIPEAYRRDVAEWDRLVTQPRGKE